MDFLGRFRPSSPVECSCSNLLVRVQIDVGFGDAVRPTEITFPSLLDFPKSSLRADPRENSIAEKLDAMIQLSIANTGMKDCSDIWHLSRVFPFRGGELAETIRATFERRSSPLPASIPLGLSDEFARDPTKRLQWRAFWKKAVRRNPMPELPELVAAVAQFLLPSISAARRGEAFPSVWTPGGPWQPV